MNRRSRTIVAAFLLCALTASAHVGSPDVYADGQAGPYRLSVVVRPPLVIPGVAEIEVRAQTPGIDRISATPVPMVGEAAKHPPMPDTMARPSADPQYFTGSLWIMAPGSWQIRFAVNGVQGPGTLSIPLPAAALATRKMQPALGALLAVLGFLLVLGMVGIVGAAAREAQLPPGQPRPEGRRGYVAMTVTFAVLIAVILLGNRWWKSDAAGYSMNVYKPLQMAPTLKPGNILDLSLRDPGWLPQRQLDDLVPDHNHLMHLYLIRWPAMDIVFHLHPEPVATGDFQLALPSMPAGDYHLYADVVHANGFPETLEATVLLPPISGRPLTGDDAEGTASPVAQIQPGSQPASTTHRNGSPEQRFRLPDGYTMVWEMPATLTPRTPESFRFDLLDPTGRPPSDMSLYMGMLGHAAFVKTDGAVFAHIHPTGTMAMTAFMMANPQASMNPAAGASGDMADMPGMRMGSGALPNSVSFPYGFPTAGRYRIFVQMKHGTTVETAAFDADVCSPAK